MPSSLKVVALGDSVTAGGNCDCTAFPQLYGAGLETKYGASIRLSNDGVGGETSHDVLTDLDTASSHAVEVAEADVVVLTIGANDFNQVHDAILTHSCGGVDDLACRRDVLVNLERNLTAIVAKIHALRGGRPTAILVTGYWSVFQDGDVADSHFSPEGQEDSDALTRAVNSVTARVAERADAVYVDLYGPFKGAGGDENPTGLLADDGDHPNARGHRVIAKALLGAGLEPLLPRGH